MARYQKYAEYKDSGVEWLGEIPSGWVVSKFGYVKTVLTDYTANGSFADLKSNVTYLDEPSFARLVRLTDLRKNLDNHNGVWIDQKSYEYLKKSALYGGEFLLANVGAYAGLFYQMPIDKGYASLAPNMFMAKFEISKVFPSFMAYVGQADNIAKQLQLSATASSAQPKLNKDDFKKVIFAHPPIEVQKQIANFLDHETAKIDSLITKQEKLIELLKEKRQSVISHAVTKGLNPDVPMKDSGVEWLGKVPEHWQLVPLKYLCTFSGGGTPTKDNLSYWTDGNIPWVSPKDMKTFWISETQDYITEKAVKESSTNIVEQNSLLMVVRSGILQRTIPIAINTVPVAMNQDMKALKFGKRVLVEYIANLIHGNTAQLLLEWSKEGATVESIEHEYLANSLIPLPSLKEQEEITQVIAKKMKVYAELTEKAKLQITLLQERRTALISSAVTGKIDVRNWQHPNEEKKGLIS